MEINKLFKEIQDDRFYSVQELADLSEKSRPTIQNYIMDGKIPTTRYDQKTYVVGRNFKKYLLGELG